VNKMNVPFERSYWVVPSKFLAGCYPGARQADHTRKKLLDLLDSGIRCVINLMYDYETDWKGQEIRRYEEELGALAEEKGIDMEYVTMSVPETSIPSMVGMKLILDKIDLSMETNKPVYVHCWGGKGRTGTVVGCYLARHGMALGRDALEMITRLRKDDVAHLEPSPENERQRWLVYSWPRGE
jgi:protein tyrosine/serine phosphatase